MWASFLITMREGLEAVLILGIVLGVLQRLGQSRQRGAVWVGVGVAMGLSILGALGLSALGIALEGPTEEIFEGLTMLLAAGVLTWMIFWMQRQGRQVQAGLEADVRQAVAVGSSGALFALSFVAVLREGIETALFLTAASFSATALQTWLGAGLGLAVAIGLGVLLFRSSKRLNLRRFFTVTGVLLLLFAAGLVARGIHELQEGAVFPVVVEHVWEINGLLDENGPVGAFLKTLFGYNGNPSLLEVIAYGVYLVVIGGLSLRQHRTLVPVASSSS